MRVWGRAGRNGGRCLTTMSGVFLSPTLMPSDIVVPDSGAAPSHDVHARTRDRAAMDLSKPHVDATSGAATLSPTALLPRKEQRRRTRQQNSTLTVTDRAVLEALAAFRVLSYAQLQRRVFPTRSMQRVGQLLQRLGAAGWVHIWDDVSGPTGRPRYVVPTRRGLGVGLDMLEAASAGTAHERLVRLMLPQHARRPLILHPRKTPAFLAHQRECNDLLLAYSTIPDVHISWASSWDRPFPLAARGIALPQPDYVLVLERGGNTSLIFGEHDRGHESLAHFRRTKAERYAALTARSELLEEIFGYTSFGVWVTVLDARAGMPAQRLARLTRLTHNAAAGDVIAFALAGQAAAIPATTILQLSAQINPFANTRS